MTKELDYVPLNEQKNPLEVDINEIDPAAILMGEDEDLSDQYGVEEDWVEVNVTGNLDTTWLDTYESLKEKQNKELK